MGMGHYLRENIKFKNGRIATSGAGYMVPYAGDLPRSWHISFNKDQTGLNTEKWNPIRSKWAGECGQIFSQGGYQKQNKKNHDFFLFSFFTTHR